LSETPPFMQSPLEALREAFVRKPTPDELKQLTWLRKALRLHLVPDRATALIDLGERHSGDDVHVLELEKGFWKVSFVERGQEQKGSACYFESAYNASHHLFWQMTSARVPITFQLDDCDPKPY
jgi:hypothetical protein